MGLVKMKTTREATAKAITKVETSKVTTMVHLLVWNVILYMRFLHYCERHQRLRVSRLRSASGANRLHARVGGVVSCLQGVLSLPKVGG
jgi:hypothetical protein